MKPINRSAFAFIFLMFFSGIVWSAQPVKIIFDTDMGPDYDDVGAMTILHALAAKGRVADTRILRQPSRFLTDIFRNRIFRLAFPGRMHQSFPVPIIGTIR